MYASGELSNGGLREMLQADNDNDDYDDEMWVGIYCFIIIR